MGWEGKLRIRLKETEDQSQNRTGKNFLKVTERLVSVRIFYFPSTRQKPV